MWRDNGEFIKLLFKFTCGPIIAACYGQLADEKCQLFVEQNLYNGHIKETYRNIKLINYAVHVAKSNLSHLLL